MKPPVSIIVATYNDHLEDIEKCCNSIFKYTEPNKYELIIVDNNSSYRVKKYLDDIKQKNKNVCIVTNEMNKGVAGGYNDGIINANGYYLLLINHDTQILGNWFKKNWLDILIDFMNVEPQCEIAGPMFGFCDVLNIKMLMLSFVMYKAEVFKKVGLFDKRFKFYGWEDQDLAYRIYLETDFKWKILEPINSFSVCHLFSEDKDLNLYKEFAKKNKEIFKEKWKENIEKNIVMNCEERFLHQDFHEVL